MDEKMYEYSFESKEIMCCDDCISCHEDMNGEADCVLENKRLNFSRYNIIPTWCRLTKKKKEGKAELLTGKTIGEFANENGFKVESKGDRIIFSKKEG